MKLAYVPVDQLSPEQLEEVRAYKREVARRFRERRKAGVKIERDKLGIGGHKPASELSDEQAKARHAYYADAMRRWRDDPANREKSRVQTRSWYKLNKEEQAAYRKKYYREKMTPERNAAYSRKNLYGLTPDQFEAMLMTQCGQCAICSCIMDVPHVDHDHVTGAIRGLLCRRCNLALGSFGDNAEGVLKALDYLAS